MRIQHNILAMNAYRNYNTNTSALAKNLEKLSSGYKINRAGDDAAGLAISEKMRAQITGLNAAQKNVKDGISLVKTAEGAMQEIQDMLNRMDYLATQSANGTYDNEVDRANLQKEVDALKSEIDRIADSANFNGINLLDGGQGGSTTTQKVTDLEGGDNVTVNPIKDGKDAGRAPQAGVYEYDLSNWQVKASGAATADVKLTVAGKTIGTIAKSAITTGSKVGIGNVKLTTGDVTIGNNKFTVKKQGNKIVLTMKKAPTSDFTTNMKLGISAPNSKGTNQGETIAANIVKEAVSEDAYKYAMASFDLSTLGIQDGSQIAIGGTVYTFKLNKEDSAAEGGENVIDLSYLSETAKQSAAKLGQAAAKALSNIAKDNAVFKVTADNTTSKIYLTERLDSNKPYDNDMVGTTANAKDANWDGLVKFSTNGGMKSIETGRPSTSGGLTLQIGDTADSYNQLSVVIGNMHCSALGIGSLDISTQAGAQSAIQQIKDAINSVSSIRGDLGAVQNRLEHTANNLSVMAENIQDAESTIRDTDVAEEMMAYTKNNILIQSAQAMLAQANAVPQGVLQLLG